MMTDVSEISSDGRLEFSSSNAAVAKALHKASGAMGDVIKNATNPAFRSKYADLASVVDAVQPALHSAGLTAIQAPSSRYDENGVVVKVETMLLHETGEWVRSALDLRPTKMDPQGVGSAITYGRRYGLLAMCGVAPDDDDGQAASAKPSVRQTAAPPKREYSQLTSLAKRAGIHELREWLTTQVEGCGDLSDLTVKRQLTAAQFDEALDKLTILADELDSLERI